jgi:phosphatidylserine synthase
METFFEYCFYRAAKFYKRCGERITYIASGKGTLFLGLFANILTVLLFIFYLLNVKFNPKIIYVGCIILFILSFFILNEKKYKELDKKYKKEKKSKLKGWLVFLYILGSVLLYGIANYMYYNL